MIKNSSFYFDVKAIVNSALAEMEADSIVNSERISHARIDKMIDTANLVSKVNADGFDKQLAYTSDRVMNSASYTDNDKFYSSSYKEMNRERQLERRWNVERERWEALGASRYHKDSKEVKHLPTIKVKKSLPSATYIRENKDSKNVVIKDDEFQPYSVEYVVVKYKRYDREIVLQLQKDDRESYINRQTPEMNKISTYLVFVYSPTLSNGKPNTHDGITKLRELLMSQKFISTEKPKKLNEMLDLLVGHKVDVPSELLKPYELTTRSDKHTVYSVFGYDDMMDILDDEFTYEHERYNPSLKQNIPYVAISEFTLRDKDSESFDSCLDKHDPVRVPVILKYECHKEFSTPCTLEYSHIGQMFD